MYFFSLNHMSGQLVLSLIIIDMPNGCGKPAWNIMHSSGVVNTVFICFRELFKHKYDKN